MITRINNYRNQVAEYFRRGRRPSPWLIWLMERVVCPFLVILSAALARDYWF